MSIAVFNLLIAILAMLAFSNMASAYDLTAIAPNFAIIAAILSTASTFPLAVSTTLILAILADSMASGPPGLYALWIIVVFFFLRPILSFFKPEKLLTIVICSALASATFDLGYGLSLSIFYTDSNILPLIPSQIWKDALATALCAPLAYLILNVLHHLWMKRSKSNNSLK